MPSLFSLQPPNKGGIHAILGALQFELEGTAETIQSKSCEWKRLLQPRHQSRVCSYCGEQVTLALSSDRTQMPGAKWQVRTREGQPSLASGKLGQDWLGARCSLCGDGMKCFQRNWLIVRDAKYLFDQTKLQLKQAKESGFYIPQTWPGGSRQWGRGGERCFQSEDCGKDVTAEHAVHVTWGERAGLPPQPTDPGASNFPDVLKGSPSAMVSVTLNDPLYYCLK